MAPLVVLAVVTGLTRLIGWLTGYAWLDSWPHTTALGLAAMFAMTSGAHFAQPKRNELIAMVPPQFPNAGAMVTLTGVLEAASAVGLLLPPFPRVAALCLFLLLLIMFPANVRAAKQDVGVKTMPLPLRTVAQAIFLGACAIVAVG